MDGPARCTCSARHKAWSSVTCRPHAHISYPPPPLVNSSPTRAQGGSRICHLPPQTEPSEAATARAPLSETTE